jgi:hypothetical protein
MNAVRIIQFALKYAQRIKFFFESIAQVRANADGVALDERLNNQLREFKVVKLDLN